MLHLSGSLTSPLSDGSGSFLSEPVSGGDITVSPLHGPPPWLTVDPVAMGTWCSIDELSEGHGHSQHLPWKVVWPYDGGQQTICSPHSPSLTDTLQFGCQLLEKTIHRRYRRVQHR